MKKTLKYISTLLLVGLLTLSSLPAMAQGLDQTLVWPEAGFSMQYPAGWTSQQLDSETYAVQSNPDDNLADSPPTAPAVLVIMMPAGVVEAMGSAEGVLTTFMGEFGAAEGTKIEQSTVGAYEAFRVAVDSADDEISLEAVLLQSEGTVTLMLAATPLGEMSAFTPTFNAMLATIVLTPPVAEAGGETSGVIRYGEMLSGELTLTVAEELWAFDGTAGDVVTITLQDNSAEGTLDPILFLLDTDSVELATNDDATDPAVGAFNSQIVDFVLPYTGTYYIKAGAFGGAVGSYILSLDSGSGGGSAMPDLPLVNAVRITLDQTLTQNWNEIDAVELVGIDADGLESGQWAISAKATSQYGTQSWSAMQATGEPNVFECGDRVAAWATATSTGQDTITLFYGLAVKPSEVNIRQTYNPGAIVRVELLAAEPRVAPIVIFEGQDTTIECPGVFSLNLRESGSDAPAGNMISYGAIIQSTLTADVTEELWTFEGAAGDVVTITYQDRSEDSAFDPVVYLLDSDGQDLTSNDDATDPAVGAFNSQIVDYVLPYTGTYVIKASQFGGTFGNYVLTLETSGSQPGAVNNGPTSGTTVAFGETVTGSFTASSLEQDWTFVGQAGQVISITMIDQTPDDMLDPYLSLLDADGVVIASNDDADNRSVGSLNSQIDSYELPASSTYTIRAGQLGENAGSYSITLVEGSAVPTAGSISVGETITSELGPNAYAQDWAFEGEAGQIVTITMIDISADDALDPYLSLLDADGVEIAYNDDSPNPTLGGSLNSQIDGFALPTSGSYIIRASQLGQSAGQYSISLEEGSVVPVVGSISYGQTVKGSLNTEVFAQDWTFDGAEGDIVTITMIDSSATQELDPVLYLLDSSGTELYSNDDADDESVGEYNSQILLFTLPFSDQYRVRASQYGTTSGTYVLTLINTR